MHQTTIRFSVDLWEALDAERERLGVSAAQFIREAALARLSYAAGRRGDERYEAALEFAGVVVPEPATRLDAVTAEAVETGSEASAVAAQSRLVRNRAQQLKAEAEGLRQRHRELF